MNKFFYCIVGVVFFGLILNLSSCQTTVNRPTGEGRYILKRSLTMPNFWEVLISSDVRSVYNAVLKGIDDMGLKIYESKVDSLSAIVYGSFADATEYNIKLSYKAPDVTLMLIRVGLLGNQDLSAEIIHATERHL